MPAASLHLSSPHGSRRLLPRILAPFPASEDLMTDTEKQDPYKGIPFIDNKQDEEPDGCNDRGNSRYDVQRPH